MKCIIIDDEPLAINVIASHIAHVDGLDLVGKFRSAMDAFSMLQSEKVDLIFLDIQMPKVTGIEFLKSLRKRPHVILCTAYRDYALEGFNLDVVDYLVKPIPFDRFLQAVGKVYQFMNKATPIIERSKNDSVLDAPPFIYVRSDKEHIKILLKDIFYIKSIKNHVIIHTANGNIITLKQIGEMEQKLPGQHFVRVHRSFLIAIDKVQKFTHTHITINDEIIPIGRFYKMETINRLQENVI